MTPHEPEGDGPDAQELEAKKRFRLLLRRITEVFAVAALVSAGFLASLLAVFRHGLTPAVYWTAPALYLALGMALLARKRAALAALCLLATLPHVLYLPRAAEVEVQGRERRALAGLRELRAFAAQWRETHGAPPGSLRALEGLEGFRERFPYGVPELVLRKGHERGREVAGPAAEGSDAGAWGYDPETGRVWIACTHTDSSGRRWDTY